MQIKKIRDLNQASVLKSQGFKLEDITWEGGVAYWIFQNKRNAADKIIQEFINGELVGNLKEFTEAQRTLKLMIYNR